MAGDSYNRRWQVPHPNSPAGWRFDWTFNALLHAGSPSGHRLDWSSLEMPSPDSPAGARFDWGNSKTVTALSKLKIRRIAPSEAPKPVEEDGPETLWWGYWKDYPKVRIGAREYAKIGNRLYTRHAVDYFQPSGRRTVSNVPTAAGEGGGKLSEGRSIPPRYVEDTIMRGSSRPQVVGGVQRMVHVLGDLEVVTEDKGKIVVTVSYRY